MDEPGPASRRSWLQQSDQQTLRRPSCKMRRSAKLKNGSTTVSSHQENQQRVTRDLVNQTQGNQELLLGQEFRLSSATTASCRIETNRASEQVRWSRAPRRKTRTRTGTRTSSNDNDEDSNTCPPVAHFQHQPEPDQKRALSLNQSPKVFKISYNDGFILTISNKCKKIKRHNENKEGGPVASPSITLLSLIVILVLASCISTSSHLFAQAYQLTNNLIANNLPPKFITSAAGQASNSEIVVRVKEGSASIGKLIYTLKGEDPDEDSLTFGVLGSMASDLLRIENVPGNQANVYLRKELDRETTESYQVVITLTDGKLGRGNWVEDVNDNYPVFGPHRTAISIREDVKVPLVIETIEASDQDEGRFGQVIYKLDELGEPGSSSSSSMSQTSGKPAGSVSNMFSIETLDGKGIISLINPLDYEQKALYQLRVLAVDRAIENERLTATISILISVEDCEDQPPMFTFVPSITRIPENLPIGSPIVRVAAVDGDRGINNQIQYKLVSVNGQENGFERNLFAINSDTGQITVAHELNREPTTSLDSWPVQVLATSGSSSRKLEPATATTTTTTITSQPGSYVIQVRASELNSASLPKDISVTTELTVILTDVNDETPTFNRASYYGEILENSAPENLVNFIWGPLSVSQDHGGEDQLQQQQQVAPSAKIFDRDQGTNGTFSLHLEGEHSQLFDIWPREATNEANFIIKVSAVAADSKLQLSSLNLDYEKSKMFQFTIVAKEKSNNIQPLRSNSAQIIVFLKDSNDNYPQFESELYKVEIPENAIRGMHICAVKATDADSGIYGSQGIRYTEIRGEKANKFKLDPITGVITLKTNDHGFDRETIGQHYLIVEARDNNGLGNRNTTQLLIILTDVNDQKPKFLLDQYETFIYENELDFQSPLQVQAVDNDAQNTPNSRVTYSIVGGDPQQNFTIDPLSGRIRVRNSLMMPNPPSTSATTARLLQPNTIGVGQMMSHQGESDIVLDLRNDGTISATLQSGLDFERIAQKQDDTRQFNLTVRASDSGLPEPLYDFAHVIILVYDKNDHAPVFTRSLYTKSIREDAKEGSQVIQVLAQDGDHSPINSKITYRISSGGSDKFAIDSDTGLISVANGANLDIDRVVGGQKRTNYLLNVIAFDGSFGPNQKSSSALVNISIIDVNNKPPEFITLGASRSTAVQLALNTNYPVLASQSTLANQQQQQQQQQQLMVVYVNEDAPYGLIITRVVAMDLDSNAELRYSINYARSEARNEDMVLVEPNLIKDLFFIEPTDGTIKVAKQLDRETFDQVKLRLQVEDIAAQTSDQVAYAYLLIKITDVNDNRPVFKKQVFKAVVNENSISGTSVITLTADDRDLNKTLKYSLDGSPEMTRLIRINPRSGEVTVNDKIDRELYTMINVTVRAEDYGHPHSLTGSTQLLVTVRDENDNNPMFLNSSHLYPGPGDSLGYSLGFDLINNYNKQESQQQFLNHNQHRNHNMNDSSNYRHRSLDSHRFETTNIPADSLSLIEPTSLDYGSTSNKRLPLLSPGSTAKIREDAPSGYQVAYVRAEDADVGNNGRVTYLIDAASSGGKFRIDRDSGIISVAGPLDRETSKQYSLIIEACDNYDLGYSTGESRRAFTQVNIQVTDINDNAPVITTNLQSSLSGTDSSAVRNSLSPSSQSNERVVGARAYPTYDDIMSSPGPYEVPLTDCLFITEFQPTNEPIMTVIATDADDPSTLNGQMDLAIVNNLPQNELFGLVTIPSNRQTTIGTRPLLTNSGPETNSKFTTSTPDYSGFGDLSLGETSSSVATMAVAMDDNSSSEKLTLNELTRHVGEQVTRPKRSLPVTFSLVPEPAAVGNFHSPSSRAQTLGSFSVMGTQHTISSLRQRQPVAVGRSMAYMTMAPPTGDYSYSQPANSQTPIPATTPTGTPAAAIIMSATMSSVRHVSSHKGDQNSDAGEQQVHIVVTQSLKERVGNYSILVRATDRGQPALSSIKLINICVLDVNNHSPVFTQPPLNHTIRIMENATIGTYVTQVEATDSDHGLNGELHYSLKPTNIQNNNNDWHSFKIDRLSGIISTAKQFNRQLKKYYTLRVQAQDFGRPTSLSSDIDINIMIVNSGQYQPEFDVQTQSVQFTENVAPGIEWFTLLPTTNLDDDPALINVNQNRNENNNHEQSGTGANGGFSHTATTASWLTNPCYFIVDSDDQEQIFHLDRYTHRLTNKKVIDRERKSNYTLLVQATNNCNKMPTAPIYARTTEVTRLNTNQQQLLKGNNELTTSFTNSVTIDYRSSDGATITRQEQQGHSENRFTRSALTRDKKSIEHQQPNQLIGDTTNDTTPLVSSESAKLIGHQQVVLQENVGFNHATVDALLVTDKTLLKVLIKIKDVNDNAPRFTQRVYTGGITTEADFGTVFMIVQAIDLDADANSQIVYSIMKPIKKNLLTSLTNFGSGKINSQQSNKGTDSTLTRQRRSVPASTSAKSASSVSLVQTTIKPQFEDNLINDDIPLNDGDDLFVINSQTGEISLNFDPQKHMKGYFEFEIMANDTDGLFDNAKVYIYLLRQDQRVKFVLRLTPQELRQRLNKFRSVFGNITGAIVNIDSYKYYENHDGTVDKKKTSLFLHFVNPDDNTIIDVDKVLTLIDNNIEYLDELYKEFHVLSSEAAYLPLSSSALIDPIDQIRTGLMGVSSFLALILVLVIALCLNQRTRYERQLKAATVSAFGGSPLHLDPDYHSQTNLPNTNLHSQDPNPIWMNGYSEQDWLGGAKSAGCSGNGNNGGGIGGGGGVSVNVGIEDGEYLSSENSDLNSLNGVNSVHQLHYNAATTATPRDSLDSSQGRVSGSGSGSGSSSTINDRQALCRSTNGRQTGAQKERAEVLLQKYSQQHMKASTSNEASTRGHVKEHEVFADVLKNGKPMMMEPASFKKRSHYQLAGDNGGGNTITHSTFGAFKEVTIYTDHQQQAPQAAQHQNLIRTVQHNNQQATSQVNKIASQFNAKHQAQSRINQVYIVQQQQQQPQPQPQPQQQQQQQQHRIVVHANGADVNQGIIKTTTNIKGSQQNNRLTNSTVKPTNDSCGLNKNDDEKFVVSQHLQVPGDISNVVVQQLQQQQQQQDHNGTAENFETNLSKLSILNLETTEL